MEIEQWFLERSSGSFLAGFQLWGTRQRSQMGWKLVNGYRNKRQPGIQQSHQNLSLIAYWSYYLLDIFGSIITDYLRRYYRIDNHFCSFRNQQRCFVIRKSYFWNNLKRGDCFINISVQCFLSANKFWEKPPIRKSIIFVDERSLNLSCHMTYILYFCHLFE